MDHHRPFWTTVNICKKIILILAAYIVGLLIGMVATTAKSATVTASIGQSTTLMVVAGGGTPPFTYQWFKDGAQIPGAMSSTYSIAHVATTDAGAYTATVTNLSGSTTSDYGVLSVSAIDNSQKLAKAQLFAPVIIYPGSFTKFRLNSVRDVGAHFNNTTGVYVVDSAGDYEIVMHARPADNSPGYVSWALYAGVQDADGSDVIWLSTNPLQPGINYTRDGGLNVIITQLNVGDQVRMGVYSTYLPLFFTSADFTIHKL